jgi:hypothetical protein
MGVVAIVIIAAMAGLMWMLVQNSAPDTVAGEAAAPAAAGSEAVAPLTAVTGMRVTDAYSIQLDQLRRDAANITADTARDSATVYGVSLEALARGGREASLSNRLPATVNEYATYLDSLRRLGQETLRANSLPADPNAYSAWLDELRRLGQ